MEFKNFNTLTPIDKYRVLKNYKIRVKVNNFKELVLAKVFFENILRASGKTHLGINWEDYRSKKYFLPTVLNFNAYNNNTVLGHQGVFEDGIFKKPTHEDNYNKAFSILEIIHSNKFPELSKKIKEYK